MDGGAGDPSASISPPASSPSALTASWSRQFEEPDSYGPEADEGALVFLSGSPAWRDVIRERFASWPDSTTFVFTYDNDFGLSDDLLNVLLTKLQISPAQFWEGEEETPPSPSGTTGTTRTTTNSGSSGRSIFHSHCFPVQVVFFSRQEYTEHNRRRIASDWTAFHLEAFLKISGLSECLKLILKRRVSIPMLLSVTSTKELNSLLRFRGGDSLTCMSLFSKLRALGDPHDAQLLSSIDVEARRLQELRLPEGAREEDDMSDTSSVVSGVSVASASRVPPSVLASPQDSKAVAATTTAVHILEEGTVAPVDPAEDVSPEELEAAEYTLVMVGSSGVGKTSLLRQLVAITVRQTTQGAQDGAVTSIASPGGPASSSSSGAPGDFDEHELPTVGAQLLRCSVGRVTVESWDTSGQDSQRRAVMMHTRRADIIFFVYDVRSPESLDHLRALAKDIIRNGMYLLILIYVHM
jgi:signal recognition particle receptor subunit beta